MEDRTPVFIVTGFLGSGKSTLLTRCIRETGMNRTAVVVNEFGEVGLDDLLVTKGGSDTVLLDTGCLCCLGSDVLADTLMVLHAQRKRGEIPPFDRVVIETSGLADPGMLMETLLGDPVVIRNFRLAGVITIVDGKLGADEMEDFVEARRQVALADRIIVTKSDIATANEQEATMAALRNLNRRAPVLDIHGAPSVPTSELLGLSGCQDIQAEDRPSSSEPSHQHNHTHGITSHLFRDFRIFGWDAYARWLTALRRIDPDRLLRTKGLMQLEDDQLYVVQGVRHVFSAPVRFEGPPQRPFLLIIARDLDRDPLAKTFPSAPD